MPTSRLHDDCRPWCGGGSTLVRQNDSELAKLIFWFLGTNGLMDGKSDHMELKNIIPLSNMPARSRSEPLHVFILGMLLLILSLGCQTEEKTSPEAKSAAAETFVDGLTARQIYERLLINYRGAISYSDSAKLYLSYSMDGIPIQEEQNWSLVWTRASSPARDGAANSPLATSSHLWSGDWFNAEVRCDSSELGCFVYDIDSGNLDDQWLRIDVQNRNSLASVLSDAIARHFLSGESELPLDQGPQRWLPHLVPPALGWLSLDDQWKFLDTVSDWSRLQDAKVDGRSCFHLKWGSGTAQTELWIDQQSFALRQMTLPLRLLDPLVTSSSEVNEIQFFARFHQVQLNSVIPADKFTVVPPRDAKAVRQFIAIPEPFPCDTVGQTVSNWRLFDQRGQALGAEVWSRPAQTSCWIWLSGLTGPGVVTRLNELKNAWSSLKNSPEIPLYLVYSNEQLDQDANSGAPQVAESWRQLAEDLQLPAQWVYDQDLMTAQQLRLTRTPAALVIGNQAVLEYARHIDDSNWSQQLVAAIERVRLGEKVSQEMLLDYQQYLERYQQKLQLVTVDPQIESGSADLAALPSVVARALWVNSSPQQAGNVYPFLRRGEFQWLVLDGYRTVLELNASGGALQRTELELPAGESVTSLRLQTDDLGELNFIAAWSPLGRNVSLWNAEWKKLQTLSAPPGDSLLDVQWGTWQGEPALLAAYRQQGVVAYPQSTWQAQPVIAQRLESLAWDGQQWFGIQSGSFFRLPAAKSDRQTGELIPCRNNALRMAGKLPMNQLCGTGIGPAGNWQLLKIDTPTLEEVAQPLGIQIFESAIEATVWVPKNTPAESSAQMSQGWLVGVSSNGTVVIWDLDRQRALRWETGKRQLQGIAGHGTPGGLNLVLTTPTEVSAWAIPTSLELETGPR